MEFYTMEHFEIIADALEEISEELADCPQGIDPMEWLTFREDARRKNPWA